MPRRQCLWRIQIGPRIRRGPDYSGHVVRLSRRKRTVRCGVSASCRTAGRRRCA